MTAALPAFLPATPAPEPVSTSRPRLQALAAPTSDERARAELFALLRGEAVYLTGVDLVAMSNLRYDGIDPDADLTQLTLAEISLDQYLFHVGDQRQVGGSRARGLHYTLSRWLLPFLLEQRATEHSPLTACRARLSDLTALANTLAGDSPMPAAVVAAGRLQRLAITCHHLTVADAAAACQVSPQALGELIDTGTLAVRHTSAGTALVQAMDLQCAGLLQPDERPHGLSHDSADLVLGAARLAWQRAVDLGVPMTGNPKAAKAKDPVPAKRKRPAKSTARVEVSLTRCAQVAAELHPVHQQALWTLRLLGPRDGELFGIHQRDRTPGWVTLGRVGGQVRDARDSDGRIVRAEYRAGTKGSAEGRLSLADALDEQAAAGLLSRRIPVPQALDQLWDRGLELFHTNLHTGEIDSDARLLAGLREEGSSGIAAFGSALRRACELTADQAGDDPVLFTPHDLRASCNTDLENAGVDGRLLRHFLGHVSENGKALDVHDRHYDLGVSDDAFAVLRSALDGLIEQAGITLCVPTQRLPGWGTSTRQYQQRTAIARRLHDLGWYAPAGTADDDPLLPLAEVSAQSKLSPSQLKRLIDAKTLAAEKVSVGRRQVWAVRRSVVENFLRLRARRTLPEAACELGVDRPSLWRIVTDLGLAAKDRAHGEAIYLDDDQMQTLVTELQRRRAAAAATITISAAAAWLGLPEGVVQTLQRRGVLQAAPGPVEHRITHLLRSSVEQYAVLHPAPATIAQDEDVLGVDAVREVLRVSRHAVTDLICARTLSVEWRERRQVVGVQSVRRYLVQHPSPGADARLRLMLGTSS